MIFAYLDYKKFTRDQIDTLKLSLKDVCDIVKIKPPYMTKVLKHTAHFTELQVYRLSQVFQLSEDEEDYFYLLLNHARTDDKAYKTKLKDKILRLREKKQRLMPTERTSVPRSDSEGMKLIEFHLSPNQQTICQSLHIAKYRANPYLLCQQLEILESEVDDTLVRLEKLGLVTRRGMQLYPVDPIPMLEETHALSAHHHRNWPIEAMKRYFPRSPDNVKVTKNFCATAEMQAQFRKRLVKLIESFEAEADESASSILFQLNVDLFAIC